MTGTRLRVDGVWVDVTESYEEFRQRLEGGAIYVLLDLEQCGSGAPITVDLRHLTVFKPIPTEEPSR
jgi:hypothetical protein